METINKTNIKDICVKCLIGTSSLGSIVLSSLITFYSFINENCTETINLSNETSTNVLVSSVCDSGDNTKKVLALILLIFSIICSIKAYIDNSTQDKLKNEITEKDEIIVKKEEIIVEKENVINTLNTEIETLTTIHVEESNQNNEPITFYNEIPPSTRETIYSPDIAIQIL